MQAVSAEFSGYAGKFRSFWREESRTVCFDLFVLKRAPKETLRV
jgi:hypothetical protein